MSKKFWCYRLYCHRDVSFNLIHTNDFHCQVTLISLDIQSRARVYIKYSSLGRRCQTYAFSDKLIKKDIPWYIKITNTKWKEKLLITSLAQRAGIWFWLLTLYRNYKASPFTLTLELVCTLNKTDCVIFFEERKKKWSPAVRPPYQSNRLTVGQ